jgi:hypothetical protein
LPLSAGLSAAGWCLRRLPRRGLPLALLAGGVVACLAALSTGHLAVVGAAAGSALALAGLVGA